MSTVYASGADSRILIAKESSIRTLPGTPVGHLLRKASFEFGPLKAFIPNPELRADPNPARDERGLQTVSGARITMPCTTDELGLILYFFLTDYSVSGVGPYDHGYEVSSTKPSSVAIEVGDSETSKYDLFRGLFVQSVSLGTVTKANNMLMVTVVFWASGDYDRNGSSSIDATPDTYSNRIHTMPDVSVEVDTVETTLIDQFTYTLSRTFQGIGALDGNPYLTDADPQRYAFDCVIGGWRDTADTIFGYDDDAEHQFEILSPRPGAATRNILIDHQEVGIFGSESGGTQQDGPRRTSCRVRPFYDDGASASSVVVTIAGDVADYSAAV